MGQLTWEQRKQIGEALGKTVYGCQSGCWHLAGVPDFYAQVGSEQAAWDAYQPDVLGEVIPWLKTNTHGLHIDCPDRIWWMVSTDIPFASGEYKDFSEAVCALMLAVLESGVTA